MYRFVYYLLYGSSAMQQLDSSALGHISALIQTSTMSATLIVSARVSRSIVAALSARDGSHSILCIVNLAVLATGNPGDVLSTSRQASFPLPHLLNHRDIVEKCVLRYTAFRDPIMLACYLTSRT